MEKKKTVFVTGATSQTGSRLVKRLIEKAYFVKCLIHTKEHQERLPKTGISPVFGSLDKPDALSEFLRNIDVLINTAHIRFAKNIINLCRMSSIKRVIFLSSTRRFTKFPCNSAKEVIDGEELIQNSGLDWTILRETMIYGGPEDNNVNKIMHIISRIPVFPLFRGGRNLIQPVFVWDVVDAIISAVENPISILKIYNIGGPEAITYKEFIQTIANALNKKIIFIPLPLAPAIFILKIYEKLFPKSFITSEQLKRLEEDKAIDISLAKEELKFSPISFKNGISLKMKGEI